MEGQIFVLQRIEETVATFINGTNIVAKWFFN
jgi:hypothetical protein